MNMKENKKYTIGVDFAETKLLWWQKILRFLGFKKYRNDYSCMVIMEQDSKGNFTIVDNKYF